MDKRDVRNTQVLGVCPSCGVMSPDGPHATTEACIRALEAEIEKLSALLRQRDREAKAR